MEALAIVALKDGASANARFRTGSECVLTTLSGRSNRHHQWFDTGLWLTQIGCKLPLLLRSDCQRFPL